MTSNKNAKLWYSLNVITEYNQTLKIFANKSTDVVVIPGIKSKSHIHTTLITFPIPLMTHRIILIQCGSNSRHLKYK